ncbi:hypothetical protein ACFU99_42115, partial [Streptomyces sp. NPDC057654]
GARPGNRPMDRPDARATAPDAEKTTQPPAGKTSGRGPESTAKGAEDSAKTAKSAETSGKAPRNSGKAPEGSGETPQSTGEKPDATPTKASAHEGAGHEPAASGVSHDASAPGDHSNATHDAGSSGHHSEQPVVRPEEPAPPAAAPPAEHTPAGHSASTHATASAKDEAWAAESKTLRDNAARRLDLEEKFQQSAEKLRDRFTEATKTSKALRDLSAEERQLVFDKALRDARGKFDDTFGPVGKEGKEGKSAADLAQAEKQWQRQVDKLGSTFRGRAMLHSRTPEITKNIDRMVSRAERRWNSEGRPAEAVEAASKGYRNSLEHAFDLTYGELKERPHWHVGNPKDRFTHLSDSLAKELPDRIELHTKTHEFLSGTDELLANRLKSWQETEAGWSDRDVAEVRTRYGKASHDAFQKLLDDELGAIPKKKYTSQAQHSALQRAGEQWLRREDDLAKRLAAELEGTQKVRSHFADLASRLEHDAPHSLFTGDRTQHIASTHASLREAGDRLLADIRRDVMNAGFRDVNTTVRDGLLRLDESAAGRFRFEADAYEKWHSARESFPSREGMGGQGDWVRNRLDSMGREAMDRARARLMGTEYRMSDTEKVLYDLEHELNAVKDAAPGLAKAAERLPQVSADARSAWHDLN